MGAEKSDLVGEWKSEERGNEQSARYVIFAFKADGALVSTDGMRDSQGSSAVSVLHGTYEVDFTQKPAVLVMHFVAQPRLPTPFDRSAIIEFISPTKLRLQLVEGKGPWPKEFGATAGVLTKQ